MDVESNLNQSLVHEYPKILSEIKASICRNNLATFRRATHSLRQALGGLPAWGVFDTLKFLEDLSENGDLSLAGEAFSSLEQELRRLYFGIAAERGEAGQVSILLADDDPVSTCMLRTALGKWGYANLSVASDGNEAWSLLADDAPPSLAIVDWLMPGMEGIEICRRLREKPTGEPTYLILLTVKGRREDVVAGLRAGADDYITKPFDFQELHARLQVGIRIVTLQRSLANRVSELENTLHKVKQLQGLLPICSYCKRIRDDQNYWQQVESYITEHTSAQVSHGVCPECYETLVMPQMAKYHHRRTERSESS